MAAPAVYLDECIDEPLAAALRQRSYTVVSAREAGSLGLSDDEQIELATRLGLPILSYNRRHFQRLHEQLVSDGKDHPGIILLLQQDSPLDRRVLRAAMLLEWVGQQPPTSRLFGWGELQRQLLNGYRPLIGLFTEAAVRTAVGG